MLQHNVEFLYPYVDPPAMQRINALKTYIPALESAADQAWLDGVLGGSFVVGRVLRIQQELIDAVDELEDEEQQLDQYLQGEDERFWATSTSASGSVMALTGESNLRAYRLGPCDSCEEIQLLQEIDGYWLCGLCADPS